MVADNNKMGWRQLWIGGDIADFNKHLMNNFLQ
jgi:hypothetical protein